MSLVWADHTGELTGIEKAVLLRMADFAADNGTQIFPSTKRLADDTGFSDKSIRRAIVSLVKKKYISKTIRTNKAVHISNLYRINVNTLQKAADMNPVKKKTPVNKSGDKHGIKQGGGVTETPGVGSQAPGGGVTETTGVGSQVPGGGVTETRNPPLIRHIDPSIAKGTTNCSKNEQQIEQSKLIEIAQSKIPDSEKIQIMKNMKRMLNHVKGKS